MGKISKARENKFYIILLIVVAILFGVFFTSKWWMYDDSPIMQTPFHETISGLDQTDLKLMDWEYNPKKKLMEVTIETIHSGSDVVKPTFSFAAKERESKEEYPVKVVYKDDSNIIVQIKNVPEDYQVIGLFVREKRDKEMLLTEYKDQLLEQESVDNEALKEVKLPDPSEKIIVGDYRKIAINNALKTKDAMDYQKDNIQLEMKQLEKKRTYILEEQIPLQDQLATKLKKEIDTLKADLEYQTEEEKEATKTSIEQKEESIKQTREEKKELEKLAEKHAEKHAMLQKKLKGLEDENGKKTAKHDDSNEKKNEQKEEERPKKEVKNKEEK